MSMTDLKPQNQRVVYEQYDSDFPPRDLVGFAEWVNAWVAKVPQEFRDAATIELSAEIAFGEPSLDITIAYKTYPPTRDGRP